MEQVGAVQAVSLQRTFLVLALAAQVALPPVASAGTGTVAPQWAQWDAAA
jgi:hypothetical protein